MRQSVQAVFKSLSSLEKTVEKCQIVLQEQKNRLTFTLHCKHGIETAVVFYPQISNDVYQYNFTCHFVFMLHFLSFHFHFMQLCIKCLLYFYCRPHEDSQPVFPRKWKLTGDVWQRKLCQCFQIQGQVWQIFLHSLCEFLLYVLNKIYRTPRPMSSPHISLYSGCWWTQSRTFLSP